MVVVAVDYLKEGGTISLASRQRKPILTRETMSIMAQARP
jgi:hypothetical protein